MTDGPTRPPLPPALSTEEAAALADRHGLSVLGERPPLRTYLRDLWQQRSFLWTLSSAQSAARHQANQLGQLWSVINPVLLIGSYFLIFGVLLKTSRGTANYIAFLSIGVIVFGVMSAVVSTGSKSVANNNGLMRALHFPRALLPLSVALTEFISNLPAFGVLLVMMLVSGEPLSWKWLLFPVSLTLMMFMLVGVALMGARIVNASRDMGNLIPVVLRVLRYISGVFFSIRHYASGLAAAVLAFQPFAAAMTTARQALLTDPEHDLRLVDWLVLAGWSAGLFTIGLVVFWWDEARYGRG